MASSGEAGRAIGSEGTRLGGGVFLAPGLVYVLTPYHAQVNMSLFTLLITPAAIALSTGVALGFTWATRARAVQTWGLGALGFALPLVAVVVFIPIIVDATARCSGGLACGGLIDAVKMILSVVAGVAAVGGVLIMALAIPLGSWLRRLSDR